MQKIILNRKFLLWSVIALLILILLFLEYRLYLADNVEKHFIKHSSGYRYLNSGQLNDFEFKLADSNMYWVHRFFSENSQGHVIHNTTNPLYGTADMRFDFVFRETNNPKAWDVGGYFQPEFENPTDFSNLREIRIALRSDKAKNWRISLGNYDVYHEYGTGDYGWDIQVTDQTQTVTLEMSEIAFPAWAVNLNPDIKADVLKSVKWLMFAPIADYDSTGFLKISPDIGYLQVDNIEFVY